MDGISVIQIVAAVAIAVVVIVLAVAVGIGIGNRDHRERWTRWGGFWHQGKHYRIVCDGEVAAGRVRPPAGDLSDYRVRDTLDRRRQGDRR